MIQTVLSPLLGPCLFLLLLAVLRTGHCPHRRVRAVAARDLVTMMMIIIINMMMMIMMILLILLMITIIVIIKHDDDDETNHTTSNHIIHIHSHIHIHHTHHNNNDNTNDTKTNNNDNTNSDDDNNSKTITIIMIMIMIMMIMIIILIMSMLMIMIIMVIAIYQAVSLLRWCRAVALRWHGAMQDECLTPRFMASDYSHAHERVIHFQLLTWHASTGLTSPAASAARIWTLQASSSSSKEQLRTLVAKQRKHCRSCL